MKRLLVSMGVLSFALLVTQCKKEEDKKEEDPNACQTMSFATDIQPLVQQSCGFDGCHSETDPKGGIKAVTYDQIKAGLTQYNWLNNIKHVEGSAIMPPNPDYKMSDENVKKLECWIEQGAENN